jgi:transposase
MLTDRVHIMVDINDETKVIRRRGEVTGVVRRRRWSDGEEGRIVARGGRRRSGLARGSAVQRMSGGMLIPPGPVRVLVATKPVDFRKGMNGLVALVQEQLKADPFSGTIYCFRSKRADRVKLVFWDGTGLCLLCKRLEDGKFHWPRVQDGVMRLSAAQLSALLEGLDWSRVHARRVTPPQAVQ